MRYTARGTRMALLAATVVTVSSGPAEAKEPAVRKPFEYVAPRTSVLTMTEYNAPLKVTRLRSDDKKKAVFSAPPQRIDPNAVVLFEVVSVSRTGESTLRWKCVASADISECFDVPLRVRYLPDDEKVELTVTAKPRGARDTRRLILSLNAGL